MCCDGLFQEIMLGLRLEWIKPQLAEVKGQVRVRSTHRGVGIDHREHPRTAIICETSKRFRAAAFEHACEDSFVRRCEFAARSVPCELEGHLNVSVR